MICMTNEKWKIYYHVNHLTIFQNKINIHFLFIHKHYHPDHLEKQKREGENKKREDEMKREREIILIKPSPRIYSAISFNEKNSIDACNLRHVYSPPFFFFPLFSIPMYVSVYRLSSSLPSPPLALLPKNFFANRKIEILEWIEHDEFTRMLGHGDNELRVSNVRFPFIASSLPDGNGSEVDRTGTRGGSGTSPEPAMGTLQRPPPWNRGRDTHTHTHTTCYLHTTVVVSISDRDR